MSDTSPVESKTAGKFLRGFGLIVHTISYALWFGGIIAIGALVAPNAFHFTESMPQLSGNEALQKAIAGGIVGASLSAFNTVSYVAGIAMLFADTLESLGAGAMRFAATTLVRSALTVALLLIAFYLGYHILPLMDRPGVHETTLFDQLHNQYVNLVYLQMGILLLIPVVTAWRNEIRKR